jgi:hypothetical protein
MSFGLGQYVDEALEKELAEKRKLLAALEEQCAQRELELTTQRVELESFRVLYWKLVAPLYARLDEIESEIKGYEAAVNPENVTAHADAERAKQKAEESRREAHRSDEVPEPSEFKPDAELKSTYKRAAKLIHPDRASDDADRARRNDIMAQVNKAYEQCDLAEIERLVEAYKAGLQPEKKLNLRELAELVSKQIAQVKQRLMEIEKELMTIMETDLAKMMRDVERGEVRGRNPLKELAADLEAKIANSLERLKAIRAKFKAEHCGGSNHDMHPDEQVESAGADANPATENTPEPPPSNSNFHPEGLIHTTDRGEKVRSKSEVIIANLMHQLELDYVYEYPLEGSVQPGIRRPDFMVRASNDVMLLWEHLGMLHDPEYQAKWESKLGWYKANGFVENDNLFVTRDEADGSLDSQQLRRVAEQILMRVLA